jgi:hypothetical protein
MRNITDHFSIVTKYKQTTRLRSQLLSTWGEELLHIKDLSFSERLIVNIILGSDAVQTGIYYQISDVFATFIFNIVNGCHPILNYPEDGGRNLIRNGTYMQV